MFSVVYPTPIHLHVDPLYLSSPRRRALIQPLRTIYIPFHLHLSVLFFDLTILYDHAYPLGVALFVSRCIVYHHFIRPHRCIAWACPGRARTLLRF